MIELVVVPLGRLQVVVRLHELPFLLKVVLEHDWEAELLFQLLSH